MSTPDRLSLTDFMDLPTLQEIQDSFAAVASVKATITDADGRVLTQSAPSRRFVSRQQMLAKADVDHAGGPQKEGREFVAPIMVNNQRLGTIRMSANGTAAGPDHAKLLALARKFGIDPRQIKLLSAALGRDRPARAAAIQFLFLLANAIARLCYQEYRHRRRIDEITAVYNVTMLLADARDLADVLRRTAQIVTELAGVKACSIRLIDQEHDQMLTKAVFNLSSEYLNKGPVRLSTAKIDEVALSEQGYEYVADMASDPRVQYPDEAKREGIASLLSVGMRYKGKPIGVLRLYTQVEQIFSPLKVSLLKSIAAQAAAAIENARLADDARAAEIIDRQVQMASEVQQRMLPRRPPDIAGLEIASVYVPCHALGGDFFDFIELPYDNIGLVIADVSGKGIPASLTMASVRAALRAQVDNVFFVYEVMKRLNLMLCRDTKPTEFVTLFYGVLDARNGRLTYVNAGHPPPLLLRDGKVSELPGVSMVLGVDPDEQFSQSLLDLKSGDTLLLYTDGLTDALNFNDKAFGRDRVIEALKQSGPTSEAVVQNILWHMRKFVGMTGRTDDVTMMVARVK
ncbi:MAG: SpoIIE family protein phosphatase [Tepidisphaeraceae bacterium]